MNEFRTGQLDILDDANSPNFENVASGIFWAPDLDTWRIATASGVRDLRTSHGLIQVYRSASAPAQTFTDTFTEVVYDNNPIIDGQYYTWDGSGTITVKEPGLYRISYTNNIDVNTGIARSCTLNTVRLDGVTIAQSQAFGYHRTADNGFNSPGKSFLAIISSHGSTITAASVRNAGTDTLEFIQGCDLSIERISALRNPTSPGFEGGGD